MRMLWLWIGLQLRIKLSLKFKFSLKNNLFMLTGAWTWLKIPLNLTTSLTFKFLSKIHIAIFHSWSDFPWHIKSRANAINKHASNRHQQTSPTCHSRRLYFTLFTISFAYKKALTNSKKRHKNLIKLFFMFCEIHITTRWRWRRRADIRLK